MELKDIFQEQKTLNEKINSDLYTEIKDPEIRRKRFLEFELAHRQESAEAVDSLNWKWWKKDDDDWDNVKIELIDMLHFWVSMCTIAGLDSKEVFDLYFKKNQLNHDRQNKGYKDGTYSKYEDGVEDNQRYVLNQEASPSS
ncbi:MAG: dUTP diphosphatase [Candidatus Margulisbacteria bacterium]|nr:dUTP diphosphatase [Candidatus Margulisiibacteriota bacterium]